MPSCTASTTTTFPRPRTTTTATTASQEAFSSELGFRLSRLRVMFPLLLTEQQVDRWSREDYAGGFDWAPPARPTYGTTSGDTSTDSFGGGSGDSGGGGGGGW